MGVSDQGNFILTSEGTIEAIINAHHIDLTTCLGPLVIWVPPDLLKVVHRVEFWTLNVQAVAQAIKTWLLLLSFFIIDNVYKRVLTLL